MDRANGGRTHRRSKTKPQPLHELRNRSGSRFAAVMQLVVWKTMAAICQYTKDAESELGGGQFLNFRNGTHGQMNQFLA